jgi:hypothetical protein
MCGGCELRDISGDTTNKFGVGFRENNHRSVGPAWYCDELQFADAKNGEQLLPPTVIVGSGSDTRAVKDGSPVAKIDPNRALVSFKKVPIAPVQTYHDAREVACREIGILAIERTALINDFEAS